MAGFGTRCLPFTKTLPKCMIPIVNKPVIEYIIEEIYASGIEEVIFVLPKYCKSSIVKKQFKKNKIFSKFLLKKQLYELDKKINSINNLLKIKTIYTAKANGTGGAVLSAKKYIKNQPFAVLNGDDLFFSQKTVLKSLIEIYEQTGKDVLSVVEVPRESVVNYGVCECDKNYEVKKIIEKPNLNQTQSNLALVGRYVLNSKFLDYLKKTKPEPSGEIYITKTMHEKAVDANDVLCYKTNCVRMDCGNKLGVLKANVILGLEDEEIKEGLKDFLKKIIKN